jgi:hypothetical protein
MSFVPAYRSAVSGKLFARENSPNQELPLLLQYEKTKRTNQ